MQFFKLVAFASAIVMGVAATALSEDQTGAMMKRCTDLWALLNSADIQPAVCCKWFPPQRISLLLHSLVCVDIDPYCIYLIPMVRMSQPDCEGASEGEEPVDRNFAMNLNEANCKQVLIFMTKLISTSVSIASCDRGFSRARLEHQLILLRPDLNRKSFNI
ncbi:hypothetical protein B0H17DRAFT_1138879 [Mycena rosella]|uniref:Uncharacterized protein n=1 Tax=Mycena rosella TaxID=1033263 RepID=A0AAD7G983_MYCRO|nr:hypothetical protein B0H17DRAFT_1138879 [Mycena rosella]